MAHVNWLGTYNNPTEVPHEWLEMVYTKLKAKYVCGQLERGKEGTPHIQFFVNLQKPGCRLAALKKVCVTSHFEPVKVNNGADQYCLKDDTRVEGPWEFGTKPVKRNSKEDWAQQFELAKQGKIDQMDPKIVLTHYRNIQAIAKDFMPKGQQKREIARQCHWYWGLPGTGKTRKVHEEYPGHYQKLANKWWDSYQQESCVVLDDIGKDAAKCLASHLKLWADPWYNHPGEIKNSQVRLNHDVFIVTSNYSIQELDVSEVDKQALLRRFKVVHFDQM